MPCSAAVTAVGHATDSVLHGPLERVAGGDMVAFAALFYPMERRIYSRAKGLLGDTNEAASVAEGKRRLWRRRQTPMSATVSPGRC